MKLFVQYVHALIIFVLGFVLIGGFIMQLRFNASLCPFCALQRVAMIGIATGEMLNLRYGLRSSHYGLAYFSALFGAAVSLKQISMHFCPGAPGYPIKVWGVELYTWAFIVFVSVMVAISILHFLAPLPNKKKETHHVPMVGWIAIGFIMLITFYNVVFC